MKYICRIGKNPGNDIIVQDRTVEDFHAQLIIDSENSVWIKDLDSKFGVWVNNERISKKELFTDDEVRIGFSIISWSEKALEWINLEHPKLETENQILEKQEQKEEKQILEFHQDSISKKLALKALDALEPEYNRKEFEEDLPKEAESKRLEEAKDLPKSNLEEPKLNTLKQELQLPNPELEEQKQELDLPKQGLDMPDLQITEPLETIKPSAQSETHNSATIQSETAPSAPTELSHKKHNPSLNSKSKSSLNPSELKLIAYVLLGLALMVILGWFLASLA